MTETRNITHTITNNNPSPTKFGGLIFYSDFETDYRGKDQNESSIAERIFQDLNFDRQCRLNVKNRNRQKTFNVNDDAKKSGAVDAS